jgi:hypothetical protein
VEKTKEEDTSWIPFSRMLDFENKFWRSFITVLCIRLIIAFTLNHKTFHPDEIWQGYEMAYQIAYSDVVPLVKTWEWYSMYSLRSIIYPLYLSLPLHFLRFFGLDTNLAVNLSITAMNSLFLSIGDVFLYKFSKNLLGLTGAKMALVYFLFNRRINEIYNKTLSNGAESILSIIAMHFFVKLKPQFDRNMVAMTAAITLAFLVRSSSLVGWFPLALYQIMLSINDFYAILQGGIIVAVPIMLFSVGMDSWYYGTLTFPQLNFVYLNVVDNMSRHFGIEETTYYIKEIPIFLSEWKPLFPWLIFSMCLYTVYHIHGCLSINSVNKKKAFPFVFVFILANFITLSSIDHKEQRFMAMIFPYFAIFWAFFCLVLIQFASNLDNKVGFKNKLAMIARFGVKVMFWIYIF